VPSNSTAAKIGSKTLWPTADQLPLDRLAAQNPSAQARAEFEFAYRAVLAEPERGMPGQIIFFGEKSLHSATVTYLKHFHAERNHQGMGNRLPIAGSEVGQMSGEVRCRERLGGLLRYYYRNAA
jgi:hypothetical protein